MNTSTSRSARRPCDPPAPRATRSRARPGCRLCLLVLCARPQTSFIVFGAIAGGIYFQEFHHLHEGSVGYGAWPLYILGVLMNVGGVAFVAWDVLNSPEDEDLGTRTHELSGAPEARATASPVLPFDARPASSPPESPPDSASAGEAAQAPSVSQLPSNTKSKSPTASSRSFSGALPCSRGKVVQAAVAPVSRC